MPQLLEIRCKTVWAVSICALGILGSPLFAHTGDVYFAVAGQAKIDGDLSDWSSATWGTLPHYTALLEPRNSLEDISAEYALMWSADTLYMAVRVRDDLHFSTRQGSDIWVDDQVGFSFLRVHQPQPSTWYEAVSWSYSLSSSHQGLGKEPETKLGGMPKGLEYLAQRVIRREGMTVYEAAVKPPFSMGKGVVMGFNVTVTDNDGVGAKGFLHAAVTNRYEFPQMGEGDVVFVEKKITPVLLAGSVELAASGHTYVHVHRGEDYVGSGLGDSQGKFQLYLLPGEYNLRAYGGGRASEPRTVTLAEGTGQEIELRLDKGLGSIQGRVRGMDRDVPVAYASVWARQNGQILARAIADTNGMYELVGLDAGSYDLTCSVAEDEIIKDVKVSAGQQTIYNQDFRSELSFLRQPWTDERYNVLLESFAYDRGQPLRAEVVERQEVAGYVREKIVFDSLDDQVVGYLGLPEAGKGPFPCVLILHGSVNLGKDRPSLEILRRDLTGAGYAVLSLDSRYYNERQVRGESIHDLGKQLYRRQNAIFRDSIIDYRRGIDYLSARSEIDTTRIGAMGGSMGSQQCTILAAVEQRIKAVVLRGPGLYADQWEAGVFDRINFAARIDKPVLALAGPYDGNWSVQGVQHLVEIIPGPTTLKWYPTNHTVPPYLYREDLVLWLRDNL